jgi:hypothetical protein
MSMPLLLPGLYRHNTDAELDFRVHDSPMDPDAFVIRGSGGDDRPVPLAPMQRNAEDTWDRLEECGVKDRPGISANSLNGLDLDQLLASSAPPHSFVGWTTVRAVIEADFSIQPTNWPGHATIWVPTEVDDTFMWMRLQALFTVIENPYSSAKRAAQGRP